MNLNTLISLCEPLEVTGPEPDALGALQQDSRNITAGDVFIAIRGYQVDGHDFIQAAIDNGAVVVICEEPPMNYSQDVCMIVVEDSRSLLGPLAQAFEGHPAEGMSIIGITGTNGKTTVATLTYQLLQKLGANPALLGTVAKCIGGEVYESKLTTADPIELAADMRKMVEAGTSHLVMEVSSHALDQQRVNGVQFNIAAFTNLSHDHLDYHETLADYAKAKQALFLSLGEDDTAVINADDEQALLMAEDCKANIINFSFAQASDVECQVLANTTEGLTIRIGQSLVESPLMGLFNAYNITEAFLIGQALGFDTDEIVTAFKNIPGAPGRLQSIEDPDSDKPIVIVDYAHTPDALRNVLQTLAELKTNQQALHVVFGCGGNRDKSKRPKMAATAETYADIITVTSDNPRDEDPDAIIDDIMAGFNNPTNISRITDRRQAITQAIKEGDANTMVLVAGKGHETYQEIQGKRYQFDDRQVAREALGNSNVNPKTQEV
ncbi:UDP-N-acetylmuramoyl-L-alanyl-D-glutamate--2,6-diaminopimelate ligase [Fodinibius salsisoli]|uniref:UDP-N-acetylmuramoyl-L-alanyl-D-glutamate--2,6-diaminopimelate ligase n=1 Tax=Fodinibius salsisoli TaxID=2820877 RepID=A0ABT3PNS4_9BACT|nr:UDP-N-acetylmuramoyl-L-alanyl-D-glutamate--2,6-diaminopimelate ligase [Fodinibius salsisoli]MCW9707504.1 UDP-N-acetylmuramoyl-L-alanyl-D-glutamate--2,6-diaminopimelate ligase [Fodinibius salsisoli]